jgi:hypothetical protein
VDELVGRHVAHRRVPLAEDDPEHGDLQVGQAEPLAAGRAVRSEAGHDMLHERQQLHDVRCV